MGVLGSDAPAGLVRETSYFFGARPPDAGRTRRRLLRETAGSSAQFKSARHGLRLVGAHLCDSAGRWLAVKGAGHTRGSLSSAPEMEAYAMNGSLEQAVSERFYAVNGRHAMTPADDKYVSEWYVPLEQLAQEAAMDSEEMRRLMLANRIPLPSYIRSDGTQMVARDLLALAKEAGGTDRLPRWFASHWNSAEEAVVEWDEYLSGQYVCLRAVTPANMKRKNALIVAIGEQLAQPQIGVDDWLDELHALVDELDELEPPFAPYDRLRFEGPVSRDRLITDARERYPRRPARMQA